MGAGQYPRPTVKDRASKPIKANAYTDGSKLEVEDGLRPTPRIAPPCPPRNVTVRKRGIESSERTKQIEFQKLLQVVQEIMSVELWSDNPEAIDEWQRKQN